MEITKKQQRRQLKLKEQRSKERRLMKEAKLLEDRIKMKEEQSLIETVALEKKEEKKAVNTLEQMELLQEDYIAWLADNEVTHDNWDEVVSKFHALEVKLKAAKSERPNFSGLNEFSTISRTI